MAKKWIVGIFVVILSILLIATLAKRFSPPSSAPKILEGEITAHVKAGTTTLEVDRILQELNLSKAGNPGLGIEPNIAGAAISPLTPEDIIARLKAERQVADAYYEYGTKSLLNIRFKEGTTREEIINLLGKYDMKVTSANDYIDPEIFIKTPVGQEDYAIKRLQSYPQVKDAKKIPSIKLGGPLKF